MGEKTFGQSVRHVFELSRVCRPSCLLGDFPGEVDRALVLNVSVVVVIVVVWDFRVACDVVEDVPDLLFSPVLGTGELRVVYESPVPTRREVERELARLL